MIAMQYSLVLPADYDMSIIDRRIAERGHLTDGFPGLAFKAYLLARKGRTPGTTTATDNVYAPFYLWHSVEGMNAFLCGPGFRGLTQSFGWPQVRTWSVWHAESAQEIGAARYVARYTARFAARFAARYAVRETATIAPHADLAELQRVETERCRELRSRSGVLAAVAAFDPMQWSLVRFQLLRDMPEDLSSAQTCVYEVGHVSTGNAIATG